MPAKTGRLQVIAVASATRHREFPEVPTFAQAGFGDFEADQPRTPAIVNMVDWVDWVDLVDSVEYTVGIMSQESVVSGVSRESATGRSVQALLASIADISGQAKRVAALPGSAFREQVSQLGRQWRGAIRLVQEQEGYLAKIRVMLASQAAGSKPNRSQGKPLLQPKTGPAKQRIRDGREGKQLEKLAQAGADAVRASMLKMAHRKELLPSSDFAKQMNWSKQGLSKALTSGRVFYVDVDGERHYPVFFLEDRYGKRQVQTVSKALGMLPGATKLLFMLTPKASLAGLTPLEALAKGKISQARAAAEAFAES